MARMNELLYALNAGGVDEEALARVDLEKMRLAGVHPVKNYLPRVLGPMSLRPGLEYLYQVPNDSVSRAIPFIFSRLVSYDLVFSDLEMRIELDGALLQVANASSTIQNPDFDSALSGSDTTGWFDASSGGGSATVSSGYLELTATKGDAAKVRQAVTISGPDQSVLHTLRIVVDRGPVFFRIGTSANAEDLVSETTLGEGTHKITFTPSAATIYLGIRSEDPAVRRIDQCIFEHTALSGTGDLVIPTPWTEAQIEDLRWFQSANTMFIADGNQQQYKIERRSDRSWSVVKYETDTGPFSTPSTNKITLTPSANTGNITITSSEPYFTSDDVGSLLEMTHSRIEVDETLSGPDQESNYITIRGVGNDRDYTRGVVQNSFVGKLVLERSFDVSDPPVVWGEFQSNSDASAAETLTEKEEVNDNLTTHYRYKIPGRDYTSGSVDVSFRYNGMNKTGVARITGFTDSQTISAEVIEAFGDQQPTRLWRVGSWSTRRGWPRVPTIYDGRLWWFRDDIAYGSVSDDFTNFDDDVSGDSGPIVRSVGSGPVEGVLWALGLQRLIAGTTGFEASIRASSFDEPLTPSAFTVKDASTLGSSDIPAIKHDRGAFYVDASDDRLNELYYSVEANDYTSRDLTRLLPNAFSVGFKRLAIQRRPDTRVYGLLNDGTCVVMTFERDDEVIAFTTIEAADSGFFEDVTVRRGQVRDYVTFVVRRTVDGNTVRYREQLAHEREQQDKSTCVLLDSAAVYSGSATATASGLCAHLVGKTVRVFADGGYDGEQVVPANGDIMVSTASTRIVAGLKYTASFESVKLAYAAQLGTAVGQLKRVSKAQLVLSNSCLDGVRVGRDASNVSALPKVIDGRTRDDDEFFTHYDRPLTSIPSKWGPDSRIYLEAEGPWPCTVQAINFGIETFDDAPPPPRG